MEDLAKTITYYLTSILEITAALVVLISLIKFLYTYIKTFKQHEGSKQNRILRIELASALGLTLELLLGADILRTAIAPNWDDIGKLAAIAILRTALNFFLEKELQSNASRLSHQQA